MKKLFPMMLEAPDARATTFGTPYWLFAFFIFPYILTLSTITSRGQPYEIWLDIGYHIINFILIIIFFLPTLKEAFFMVRIHTKAILKTAGTCAAIIVILRHSSLSLFSAIGNYALADAAFGSLLTTETDLLFFSTALLGTQPLWGALCFIFLTPITTACLLYGCAFAPICTSSRPWLAYPVMAFTLLLIRLSMAFCLWPLEQELYIYAVTLPVHLLACWSYQKTDNIWTPIFVHSFANLMLLFPALRMTGIL